MRLELRFERGAIGAALDQRSARRLIDLLHVAHLAQVDRHSTFVILAQRLDTAAHARSAAERRDGRVGAAGPVEHGSNFALVARIRHHVGRVRVIARKTAREIGIRFAEGVRGAVVVVTGAESGAKRAR